MQFFPSSLEGFFKSNQINAELICYSAIFSGLAVIEGFNGKLIDGQDQPRDMRYPLTDPLCSKDWVQRIANDPQSFNYSYLFCRAASSCKTKSAVDQFKSHLRAGRLAGACRSMNDSFYTWCREVATKNHKTRSPGGTHVFPVFSKLPLEQIQQVDQITKDQVCSVLTVGFNKGKSGLICADHWQGEIDLEGKAPSSERFSFRDVNAVAIKPETAEFIDLFEFCDDRQRSKLKLALPQSLSDFVSYLDNEQPKHIDGRERLAGNPNGKVQNCQTEIECFLKLWAQRAEIKFSDIFGEIIPPKNMLGLGLFSDKKASLPPTFKKTILYTLVELTKREVVTILGVGFMCGAFFNAPNLSTGSEENYQDNIQNNVQKSSVALQGVFFLGASILAAFRLLSIHIVIKTLMNHQSFIFAYSSFKKNQ